MYVVSFQEMVLKYSSDGPGRTPNRQGAPRYGGRAGGTLVRD